MIYDMSLIRANNTRHLKISATAFFLDHWSSTFGLRIAAHSSLQVDHLKAWL
jgi:hypothetical protein